MLFSCLEEAQVAGSLLWCVIRGLIIIALVHRMTPLSCLESGHSTGDQRAATLAATLNKSCFEMTTKLMNYTLKEIINFILYIYF